MNTDTVNTDTINTDAVNTAASTKSAIFWFVRAAPCFGFCLLKNNFNLGTKRLNFLKLIIKIFGLVAVGAYILNKLKVKI